MEDLLCSESEHDSIVVIIDFDCFLGILQTWGRWLLKRKKNIELRSRQVFFAVQHLHSTWKCIDVTQITSMHHISSGVLGKILASADSPYPAHQAQHTVFFPWTNVKNVLLCVVFLTEHRLVHQKAVRESFSKITGKKNNEVIQNNPPLPKLKINKFLHRQFAH